MAIHLEPGSVVGRDFRVVRPLAEGGMGTVYVAEQLSTGRLRAFGGGLGQSIVGAGAPAPVTSHGKHQSAFPGGRRFGEDGRDDGGRLDRGRLRSRGGLPLLPAGVVAAGVAVMGSGVFRSRRRERRKMKLPPL